MEVDKTAKLYLKGGSLELGCNQIRRSKTETLVRMRKNATWTVDGGANVDYGTTIEILEGALLISSYFTMNSGSVLITANNIIIDEDAMIGRNVTIYDSDHHSVRDWDGNINNPSCPVRIGRHVWLATNTMVLKGCSIGENSIIGAGTIVNQNIPEDSMVYADKQLVIREGFGRWSRSNPDRLEAYHA